MDWASALRQAGFEVALQNGLLGVSTCADQRRTYYSAHTYRELLGEGDAFLQSKVELILCAHAAKAIADGRSLLEVQWSVVAEQSRAMATQLERRGAVACAMSMMGGLRATRVTPEQAEQAVAGPLGAVAMLASTPSTQPGAPVRWQVLLLPETGPRWILHPRGAWVQHQHLKRRMTLRRGTGTLLEEMRGVQRVWAITHDSDTDTQ